nr:MFS transporter [uncultured Cellulosilyticum sp.]
MKKNLSLVCIAVFILVIGTGIVAPLLTPYAQTLGATGVEVGLLFSGFYSVRILMGTYIGKLADKKGPKAILRYSLILYPIIAVLYVCASNYIVLFIARLFHGMASAMMLPMVMAYIGKISPKGQESKYMGVYNTVIFIANGIGPTIGGLISKNYGYQMAFSSLLIVSLISLVIVGFLPTTQLDTEEKDDNNLVERKTKKFVNKKLIGLGIINVISAILSVFTVSFYAMFLTKLEMDVTVIGILLTINNLIIGGSQVIIATMVERVQKKKLIIVSGLVTSTIVLLLRFTDNFIGIVTMFVILSIASAVLLCASSALATIMGREEGMGETMGFLGSATSLGAVIGPLVLGALVDYINVEFTFYFVVAVWILGIGTFGVFYRSVTEQDVNQEYSI